MAQSINTRVDVVVEATSYQGLTNYGKIMVGDKDLNSLIQEMSMIIFRFHGKKLIM